MDGKPCQNDKKIPKVSITKNTDIKKVFSVSKRNCENCKACCEVGSGFILPKEVKLIAKTLGVSEEEFKKKYLDEIERFHTQLFKPKLQKGNNEYGPCVFLTEKGCNIQKTKPLHCQIGSWNEYSEKLVEWFDLNYVVNKDDPESVRQWASKLKFKRTIPGGELHELVPDKKLLKKMLEYEV